MNSSQFGHHLDHNQLLGNGKTASRSSVYSLITERIVALLEKGTVPWRKPWKVQIRWPHNLVSHKPYRGINVFLLLAMSYESPFWLTFRQANQRGGTVRRGEKACPVIFWKPILVEDKEKGEPQQIPVLRYYQVFNVAQCDGLKDVPIPTPPPDHSTKPAEVIEKMPQRPEIKHGMACAYYSPHEDVVGMPHRERFSQESEYYSTLFHELIHSTGHKTRLNRPTLTEKAGFGSDPCCKEELIAEMGATFLCGQAGIADLVIDNSAAYVSGWLGQLQKDKTLIVQAAAQAQLATDFILGTQAPRNPTEANSPPLL